MIIRIVVIILFGVAALAVMPPIARQIVGYLALPFLFMLVTVLPCFPVFLVIAWILTTLHAQAHRRFTGRWCPRCRYDLTGNVTGICSECGEDLREYMR